VDSSEHSMPSRRERIETMLADEPHDTFLRYSLALELDKEGNHERSLEMLRGLMDESPAYVPAFLMTAQQLTRLARIDDARAILREGIEQARQQGEAHAAGEMGEFLASLGSF
jgi:tetratricopeptide (TPR) repeat protein